ncbi:hypothetical protein H0H93_006421 [Arthromyces matolae]|nr:hypothetical protein H0H93_006421 [Arthromyces matolae]
MPVPRARPVSPDPSLSSVSHPYLRADRPEILLQVIPPDDDDRASHFSSVSFDQRSSSSVTVATANPVTSQILEVKPNEAPTPMPIEDPAILSDGISNEQIYALSPHKLQRYQRDRWIFIDEIEDCMRTKNLIHDEDTTLAIEIVQEDGKMWCGYYFACSATRQVSWLDRKDLTKHAGEVRGDISATHIMKDRFINYHGQYGARLDSRQSVHKTKKDRRTLLIRIFSPLLFAAPDELLKSLKNHWVDQITIKARWVKFYTKMNVQWGQHIVHSSILLNANVAFLAIPSNDPSNNSVPQPHRTVAQIASYVSILTSFGSMMLALLLVRKHKAKEDAIPLINDYVSLGLTDAFITETVIISAQVLGESLSFYLRLRSNCHHV